MSSWDPFALGAVRAYCGWDPTALVVDQSILLDGTGKSILALPCLMVTAVASVSVTDHYGVARSFTVGPGQDVDWSENGLIEWQRPGYFNGFWPQGRRNVNVVYSGGYVTPPAALVALITRLGPRLATADGVVRRKMDMAEIQWTEAEARGELQLIEQMILDQYRIVKVA